MLCFRVGIAVLFTMIFLGAYVPHVSAELPRNLIQQGERFLTMGKYPAAMSRYSKVLACCPGTIEAAEAHNDIGVIHARQGKMDLAITSYEAALQEPAYPLAHFNLGKIFADQFRENHDEAVRVKALFHLQAFRSYLSHAETLPPIITCQRVEIEQYLTESIEYLSSSR